MKELDLATLIAVFEEMLGWTLWPIVAACVLATLAFLFVLLRDRGVVPGRMLRAEAAGAVGGIGAVAAMFLVTSSSPADMGGPIDWLLVVALFIAGLIGTTIGVYAAIGLAAGQPDRAPVAEVRQAAQPSF
jgi:hypothetical protein